jgi:hypothetical protein
MWVLKTRYLTPSNDGLECQNNLCKWNFKYCRRDPETSIVYYLPEDLGNDWIPLKIKLQQLEEPAFTVI